MTAQKKQLDDFIFDDEQGNQELTLGRLKIEVLSNDNLGLNCTVTYYKNKLDETQNHLDQVLQKTAKLENELEKVNLEYLEFRKANMVADT